MLNGQTQIIIWGWEMTWLILCHWNNDSLADKASGRQAVNLDGHLRAPCLYCSRAETIVAGLNGPWSDSARTDHSSDLSGCELSANNAPVPWLSALWHTLDAISCLLVLCSFDIYWIIDFLITISNSACVLSPLLHKIKNTKMYGKKY